MNMKYAMLLGFMLWSVAAASAGNSPSPLWFKNLSEQVKDPVYLLDIDRLFSGSIEKSYKVNAQRQVIESELLQYAAARHYYIPAVTIAQHVKKKFDRPSHPSPYSEYTLDISETMKLWSNATGDKKDAAYYQLLSARHTYNALVNEVYTTVNTNLVKIELSRNFLGRSAEYRRRLDNILRRLEKSTKTGVLKRSDRLFADVALKKFEESVLNVQARIEQYKTLINNITPANLYQDGYGVSRHYVGDSTLLHVDMFDIQHILKNNFEVQARKAALEAEKARAKGYNENFTVELASQQGIKEHRLTGTGVNGAVPYGYSYDPEGESFIGIRVVYTGLDFQAHMAKRSEYALYTRKVIELDEYLHQLYVDINAWQQQYRLIKDRLDNINNQIVLTNNVIQSLMKELIVDESSVLDIFSNVTSLADLEMNRLMVHNELIDLSMRVKSLNGVIPERYVLN